MISKSFLRIVVLSVFVSGCSGMVGGVKQEGDEHLEEGSNPEVSSTEGSKNQIQTAPIKPNTTSEDRRASYFGQPPPMDAASSPEDPNQVSTSNNPNFEPEKKMLFKNGSRATREDFIDQSQEEGSLWASNGQTNYYFTKNKVRSPGDLITLVIENQLYRDMGLEIKNTLSPKERSEEVLAARDQARSKLLDPRKDSITTTSASPERSLASAESPSGSPSSSPSPSAQQSSNKVMTPEEIQKEVNKVNLESVDIFPELELKVGDTLTGEILERFSNGNYKIRVQKRVPYKRGETRIVRVVGVVKASDITEDTDTLNSGRVYEYRIEIAHSGN